MTKAENLRILENDRSCVVKLLRSVGGINEIFYHYNSCKQIGAISKRRMNEKCINGALLCFKNVF